MFASIVGHAISAHGCMSSHLRPPGSFSVGRRDTNGLNFGRFPSILAVLNRDDNGGSLLRAVSIRRKNIPS